MGIRTERLVLRKWTEEDAESLFMYAKNPNVGPVAGWPVHESVEASKAVIQHALNGKECYAISEKENLVAIGSIELLLHGNCRLTSNDDECELGFWLGEPFWGRGYVPEAAKALMQRAFEELHMSKIWCGYYEGNEKSKRVQEKLGFTYHHTRKEMPIALLNKVMIAHINVMTKQHWEAIKFLEHIDRIHTTDLGVERIRRNLKIDNEDVVAYCRNMLMDKNCKLEKRGKNWYCTTDNIVLTINAGSYTLITAHMVKRRSSKGDL